ncbi:MAG: aminotransferase class I/II-fold pyridoxal phosphate-dependent enzyme [Flavobacteriaceae bacterium]|nr:aminotransferase class I/II-fold pyridoxal phosphate-dependent enzyme [Flavobacteriaceae bacterium]
MIEVAKRLHTVKEYYFSQKLRVVNLMKDAGLPIINLGIGSPDMQPPQMVLTAISDSLSDKDAHRYQSYQGLFELRKAMSAFYKKEYGVSLSPKTEILPLMGSKEGIMHISMAFLNEGDEVLIPNPGYPTYASVTKLVGAKPKYYDLKEGMSWQPNLLELEQQGLSKVKLMWVNYPHMPTGEVGDYKLFEDLIAFAKRHKILLVNDNPYSFILNEQPRSLLKIPHAKEVCLELNSLSKTFNMGGWRVGMLVGSESYIASVLKVKSNMDSGMFYGVQKGAIQALKCSKLWYMSLNNVYRKRRKLIWTLAEKLNCTYEKDVAGLFVWAKLPQGQKSEDVVETLLKKYHFFVAPGFIFGSNGEGYLRFSLCTTEEEIQEVISRLS